MSPQDLPLWYLKLNWSQAEARCAADVVPADYWHAYQKAWIRRHGRAPLLRNNRGRWHASKDLARAAYSPSASVSASPS